MDVGLCGSLDYSWEPPLSSVSQLLHFGAREAKDLDEGSSMPRCPKHEGVQLEAKKKGW